MLPLQDSLCFLPDLFRCVILSVENLQLQNVLKPTVMVIKCVTGANVSAHYS